MVVMIKMRWKRASVIGVVVAVCALGWFLWRRALMPDYEVIYLPFVKGTFSGTLSINDRGQVAGNIDTYGSFVWDEVNGTNYIEVDGRSWCHFLDINNEGQVVGQLIEKGQFMDTAYRAFAWQNGIGMAVIPGIGNESSLASAINNRGQIAGSIISKENSIDEETRHIFLWDAAEGLKVINEVKGRNIEVRRITDSGEIVGVVGNRGNYRTFVWSKSGGTVYMDPQESLAKVWDVDRAGNVLGEYYDSRYLACFWNKNEDRIILRDFGYDQIVTCRMNDVGDIVGRGAKEPVVILGKYRISSGRESLFLRKKNGKIVKLDRLFGKNEVFNPRDINNKGWIVGWVHDKETRAGVRAVLLRPE